MTLVITHSQVAGTGVDTDAIVDGADWDANHVLTGVISPAQGGTGIVNNDSSTLTISGAFGTTFTVTATTSLTLPTTGTLATTSNKLSDFAATTSAELKTVISDETGSGALVFATSPTLVTPTLGVASATSINKVALTAPATGSTLTIADGKTLTASNTLTFTGTDASSVAFGTGGTVLYSGGALGTPSSGTLTNCTGLPISTGLTGTGTGVLTALAVNVGSAGAFVTFNGALGTPSSGTLTNATGLPISTGVAGLGTGIADFLATPSSANLATAVTGETGSGALVFATSPTLVTPALGTPSSGTLTNCTGLPLSGLTTQAAYTIVANNSGSSAVPTAVDITALTAKASPASGDFFLITDGAASNAFKKVDATNVAAASGVSSIAGNTGAFTLSTGITNSVNDIRADVATATNYKAGTANKLLDAAVLANTPCFSVTKGGTDQTGIADATFTAVTWSTEVYDVGSYFASNTWTPPAGKVTMSCGLFISGTFTAGSQKAVSIFKNGSSLKQTNTYGGSTTADYVSITVDDIANGTDAYTIQVYADVSSGTATVAGNTNTFWTGHWICP